MCKEDSAETEQVDTQPDTSAGVRLPDGSTYYNVDGDSVIEVSPEPTPW